MGIRVENNNIENQYFEQDIGNQSLETSEPDNNLIIDLGHK